MTYGELKKTELYQKVDDSEISINGGDALNEMYFPEELDDLLVVGTGIEIINDGEKLLHIDLACDDKQFLVDNLIFEWGD